MLLKYAENTTPALYNNIALHHSLYTEKTVHEK
jgi:hypothetical protein